MAETVNKLIFLEKGSLTPLLILNSIIFFSFQCIPTVGSRREPMGARSSEGGFLIAGSYCSTRCALPNFIFSDVGNHLTEC